MAASFRRLTKVRGTLLYVLLVLVVLIGGGWGIHSATAGNNGNCLTGGGAKPPREVALEYGIALDDCINATLTYAFREDDIALTLTSSTGYSWCCDMTGQEPGSCDAADKTVCFPGGDGVLTADFTDGSASDCSSWGGSFTITCRGRTYTVGHGPCDALPLSFDCTQD